ncbi:thioesterase superfamily protein [Variibacter gotjawalensis]|uniref:Thioesterase superfamily protein n=1 Tax=Variibacter gotjawalensis TaxID=1333996 RepID=A0A0S3PYQ1_9BRAD|nr:PaaI family thioesterase [Variibacter gotjawalensis]NIK46864.1 uncharacterized protein (TIGR00369 family) [Variibacter gotjawalensis]RZS48768.1 uncharacterized protein (TIGR00369 family) [Variibacter gotjawalensis]BAT61027.1 thioesterase superfamily protein [Variibacter gotjawalensis]
MSEVPEGFARHTRKSPLTEPWEPIYAKRNADSVHLGLRLAEAHTNSRGFAHGGLISTLADNAMGLSCGLALGGNTRLVTVSLNVDFIGAAKPGQWLEIAPTVIRAGSTLCFVQALITADGEICARASATFRTIKPT